MNDTSLRKDLVHNSNSIPAQTTATFTDSTLDEAMKKASFSSHHPYIRWPAFGRALSQPGPADVAFLDLKHDDTPGTFIARCTNEQRIQLSVKELAELVPTLKSAMNGDRVFCFGEKYNVAGYDGYPFAQVRENRLILDLWYFEDEWPEHSVVAVRNVNE